MMRAGERTHDQIIACIKVVVVNKLVVGLLVKGMGAAPITDSTNLRLVHRSKERSILRR